MKGRVQNHRQLAKLLQANAYRHHLWDVFGDFVEMAAISLSNAVDLINREAREARYMQIIGKYEPAERERFPLMFAELVMEMERAPGDVLGSLFGELELGNAARGQFFTPFEVCELMARVILGDADGARAEIAHKGFITVNEPACGAGAMVIAFAHAALDAGINYQQHIHVTAQDVDSRAVHMAYVQFSLLHIPAVVILGNTIAMEEREHWRTPAHVLDFWENKLRRGYALGSYMDGAAANDELPVPMPAIAADITIQQGDLFGPPLEKAA